jgi:GNAT superfamily N-acetyltransferase
MSDPTIRRAMPDDAVAFSACHLACWREAYENLWGSERFAEFDPEKLAVRRRKEIEAGNADHFMAEQDGEVIGIAIAGPARDEDPPTDRELYAIYVRSGHQGSGVADELLDATIGSGPASLWVYRDNPRASAFYVHHDFIPDGSEKIDSAGILEIRMVRR